MTKFDALKEYYLAEIKNTVLDEKKSDPEGEESKKPDGGKIETVCNYNKVKKLRRVECKKFHLRFQRTRGLSIAPVGVGATFLGVSFTEWATFGELGIVAAGGLLAAATGFFFSQKFLSQEESCRENFEKILNQEANREEKEQYEKIKDLVRHSNCSMIFSPRRFPVLIEKTCEISSYKIFELYTLTVTKIFSLAKNFGEDDNVTKVVEETSDAINGIFFDLQECTQLKIEDKEIWEDIENSLYEISANIHAFYNLCHENKKIEDRIKYLNSTTRLQGKKSKVDTAALLESSRSVEENIASNSEGLKILEKVSGN